MQASRFTRAVRNRISYRESSVEDDDGDSTYASDQNIIGAAVQLQPSSAQRRDNAVSPARRHSTRESNRVRRSLKEPSSDEDDDEDFVSSNVDELEHLALQHPPPKRRKVAPSRPVASRTRRAESHRTSQSSKGGPRKRRTVLIKSLSKSKARLSKKWAAIDSDGVRPPWSTLPYHILLSIFDYAYELHMQDGSGSNSAAWLLHAARTCHAYSEPALTVLYRRPALINGRRIISFANHITGPAETQYINYRPKVRELVIDERHMPSNFDLTHLIRHLPQLAHVDLFSSKDTRPLRGNAHILAERYWKYPPDLFNVLQETSPSLISWHWNAKMHALDLMLADQYFAMIQRTESRPFSNLKDVTFTNYNPLVISTSHIIEYQEDYYANPKPAESLKSIVENEWNQALARSIQGMSRVRRLRFEFCKVVSATWLQFLPKTLTTLELYCCANVETDGLQAYLESYGTALRTIVLDHNRYLSLDFLACLKSACPNLEELSMDLIYFEAERVSTVVQPGYLKLLQSGSVPSWPSCLMKLSLTHLRQWDSDTVNMFFESIISQAESLQQLRQLSLSVSVDIDWHERAGFRDKWTSLFQTVFKRTPKDPVKYLQSMKTYRLYKEAQKGVKRTRTMNQDQSGDSSSTGRLRPRGTMSLRRKATDVLSSVESESTQYIQGKCDVVDIRIDNSRPNEREFRESDMMDSEISGDSDYHS
jgi:hypothetical protein